MKILLSILLSILALTSNAKLGRLNNYIIVSDIKKSNVPKGKCRVKGNVSNGDIMVVNGIVSNLDRTRTTTTDSSGNYEFYINASDTSIFFFKETYHEVVVWNYNFQAGHEVVVNFSSTNAPDIQIVDKPVIYLYAEQDVSVSLQLNFKGDFIFTYPNYDGEWDVEVKKEGIFHPKTNRTYPYLFWEGETNGLNFESSKGVPYGFLIATDTCAQFLTNAVTQLGLNTSETSDFVTYWGPRLIKNDFAFIQFLVDEDYEDNIAEINVVPQPQSMRRLFMLFTPYDKNPDINFKEQQLPSFTRSGFTLIEWGGSELNNPISD